MTITIYSTTTCSFCNALTDWLDKKGIAYTKKMTDEDDTAMDEFLSVNDGILAVPFTIIETDDGQMTKISGFDQAKFTETLDL